MKKILIVFSLAVTGCGAGKNKTNVEIIQGMMDQVSVKSQDIDPLTGENGMRLPPEGTVPRGFKPYLYKGEAEKAGRELVNPFRGDDSPAMVEFGQKSYSIYCGICHGATGKGDGSIAASMPLKPPSLLSTKVKSFSDGRIFHIITDGQGVMGSYANQITDEKTRWAVVNYIRGLQKEAQ